MKDRFDIDEFLELKRRWEAFRVQEGACNSREPIQIQGGEAEPRGVCLQ